MMITFSTRDNFAKKGARDNFQKSARDNSKKKMSRALLNVTEKNTTRSHLFYMGLLIPLNLRVLNAQFERM